MLELLLDAVKDTRPEDVLVLEVATIWRTDSELFHCNGCNYWGS